jgi:hypothetical protein
MLFLFFSLLAFQSKLEELSLNPVSHEELQLLI